MVYGRFALAVIIRDAGVSHRYVLLRFFFFRGLRPFSSAASPSSSSPMGIGLSSPFFNNLSPSCLHSHTRAYAYTRAYILYTPRHTHTHTQTTGVSVRSFLAERAELTDSEVSASEARLLARRFKV